MDNNDDSNPDNTSMELAITEKLPSGIHFYKVEFIQWQKRALRLLNAKKIE